MKRYILSEQDPVRWDDWLTWNDPAAYAKAVAELNQANMAAFTETAKIRHEVALAKAPQLAEAVDRVERCPEVV